jgi:hypothetical protein
MDIILITLGFAVLLSPITLLIGLYKVIFQKEDKAFGIKLLTYSTIVLIIGLGTCVSMNIIGF